MRSQRCKIHRATKATKNDWRVVDVLLRLLPDAGWDCRWAKETVNHVYMLSEKLPAWTREQSAWSAWKVMRVSNVAPEAHCWASRLLLDLSSLARPWCCTSFTAPYARRCWSHSPFPWAFDLARIRFSRTIILSFHKKLCLIYYSWPTAAAWFLGNPSVNSLFWNHPWHFHSPTSPTMIS